VIQTHDADVVIVGAGSAGCLLANRLSADPNVRVTVIEAGGEDRHPWIRVPIGYARTIADPRVNWCYRTQAATSLDGRAMAYPLGKTLGGSSAINGLAWVHGQSPEYEQWGAVAGPDWDWPSMRRALHAIERTHESIPGQRGRLGGVAIEPADTRHPAVTDAMASAVAVGLPLRADYNDSAAPGVSPLQLTVSAGRRVSAAHAFLHPVRDRKNLRVFTGVRAHRVRLVDGRAVAVEAHGSNGAIEFRAHREIILCAGAVHSPHLLMLSGIGPLAELQSLGLPVHVDRRDVGRNLQDHVQLRCVYELREGATLNQVFHSRWRRVLAGLQYGLRRRGWLAQGALRAVAYARSGKGFQSPDLQIFVALLSTDRLGDPPHRFPGMSFSVVPLRPRSRGMISLVSSNPEVAPRIDLPLLEDPADLRAALAGIDWARRIVAQRPLSDRVAREVHPGPLIDDRVALEAFARQQATTIYHPAGTCRMGRDSDSVVDSRLRVRGVSGLRVIDASVMPVIASGNTNAPTLALAHRAADLLISEWTGRHSIAS